jgi:tetratricopeptide (TPR) repeat protein
MSDSPGLALLDAGDWDAASEAFEAELAIEESPEAHDGLGRAAWWLGRPDEAIAERERAFVLWKDEGDRERAALVAIWLAREHLSIYGNDAVANGWLARAERLIGDARSIAAGWLELARGRRSGDPADRDGRATQALAIAHEFGDPSLEVAALADLGLAAIERGDAVAGLDRLDEAMAAATSGEVDLLETVAETCCSLVAACELANDAGRLEQWARIVDTFVRRRGDLQLLTFCQTCNAELL